MHLRAALPRGTLRLTCLRAARRYLSTPSWEPPLSATLSRHVDSLVGRHAELQAALERGAFDVAAAKELARLEPVVVARAALDEAADEARGLHELSVSAAEPELRELAIEESGASVAAAEARRAALLALLVPREEHEEGDAIIEVHAGVGGQEAGLFASDLLKMYAALARRRGWRFELLEQSHMDDRGTATREATASVSGGGAFAALNCESGVHRVQRVPDTEAKGRVHTSTAVVVVLPEVATESSELRDADVQVDVYRASGAGGQHVNTTESAVRLTHTPTGIKVSCQSERSQHQNKATAMRVLRARLAAHDEEVRKAEHDAVRGEQASTGARSERIRTYNFPDDRVTDHRLDGSKFGLPRMLTTAETLDELVEDLREQQRAARLEEFLKEVG